MTCPQTRSTRLFRSRKPAFLWVAGFGLLSFWGTVIYDRLPGSPLTLAAVESASEGLRQAGRPRLGRASWYGAEFDGSPTASGEPFDRKALTAAHRSLPLGSHARVRNLENGREVVVRINDRGPYHLNRVIDLSHAAAEELRMVVDGSARVQVIPLEPAD